MHCHKIIRDEQSIIAMLLISSGKTTLARSLSTIASTAAFDKNPQSKERGITLDLGFSSFQVESPPQIQGEFEKVQYTLVDCPGHGN